MSSVKVFKKWTNNTTRANFHLSNIFRSCCPTRFDEYKENQKSCKLTSIVLLSRNLTEICALVSRLIYFVKICSPKKICHLEVYTDVTWLIYVNCMQQVKWLVGTFFKCLTFCHNFKKNKFFSIIRVSEGNFPIKCCIEIV